MKKIALSTFCLASVLSGYVQAMQTQSACKKETLKLTIPPATPINPETAVRIIEDVSAHIRLATLGEQCCTASEVVAILWALYAAGTGLSNPGNSEDISLPNHGASQACQSALCIFMASLCHDGAKEYREIKHSRLAVAAPQAITMTHKKPDTLAALLAAEKAPR